MKSSSSALLVLLLTLNACGATGKAREKVASKRQAIAAAHRLYRAHKGHLHDLAAGPCLSNGGAIPGWVVDIAHEPRKPVDNLPQNQCSAYRNGKVRHFIELTPAGRFTRAGP